MANLDKTKSSKLGSIWKTLEKSLYYSVLALLFTVIPTQAAEPAKVGLVLSGGGARGAAHIGVIKELERQGIPIDYIAGTSMGAIIGGLYSMGKSTDQIEQLLDEINWGEIFSDNSLRRNSSIRRKFDDDVFQVNKQLGVKNGKVRLPSGFIKGQNLQLLLDRLFLDAAHVEHFDQLAIPFRAVATDISTGAAVVLKDGSLATAIRASMSVPSVFSTVKYKDYILVDGGISNNLPVDVVREMGADVVIAVDIGSTLQTREKLNNLLEVSLQLTNLLVRNTTNRQIETLTEDDILIVPELGNFSSADFSGATQIIGKGVVATEAMSTRLESLSLSREGSTLLRRKSDSADYEPPVISSVKVNNETILDDDFILDRVTQKPGEILDFDQLEMDIGVIFGLGNFESVTYEIVQRSEGNELVLNLIEKSWGPRYLQFGVRFESNLSDSNDLSAAIGYTVSPLNSWNGEWRSILKLGEEKGIITELNLPVALNSPYYVNGSIQLLSERFNTFVNGQKINQVLVDKFGATLALGRELDLWGDFRLGYARFQSTNEISIGTPVDSLEDTNGGELFVQLRADTLDHAYFPQNGYRAFLNWTSSREDLGSDSDFDQIQIDGTNTSTWGRLEHTLFFGARVNSTLEGFAPVQSRFRLGGLFSLPGFSTNELSGQNLYLLRSGYQRKIGNILGSSPYFGFSAQYGNVFQRKEYMKLSDGIAAGSVWLGWDTILGPIYFGYGLSETNDHSLYLSVGGFF